MSIKHITLLMSDFSHPIYPVLKEWVGTFSKAYSISLVKSVNEVPPEGDILFLVSCSEFVTKPIRQRFRYTLVLHASDLPQGKGWSPHVWSILQGASKITVSLINAEDEIDSGDIWQKVTFDLDGTELYQEINQKLFAAELSLIEWACKHIDNAKSQAQQGEQSYFKRRSPEHSRIDPELSLAEQFDLLRVCDEERFPAYFDFRGQRYRIRLEKVDE